ncbi:MAG: hypothetical protein AAFY41_19935, partial [Bacteroidota bacterium]
AMAYSITYYLESFERTATDLRYRGRIQFQNETKYKGLYSRREIKSKRKRSYYGSLGHFKKALLSNTLRQEGFRIYKTKDLKVTKPSRKNELSEEDIIAFKGASWELDFEDYLMVIFNKEKESVNFLLDPSATSIYGDHMEGNKLVKEPGKQISMLKVLDGPVEIDLNGQVLDKFALTSYG